MELAVVAQSISYGRLSKPPSSCSSSSSSSSLVSPSFFQCKTSLLPCQTAQNLLFKRINLQLIRTKPCLRRNIGVISASSDGSTASVDVSQGWLLEPVGDGDWKHIGSKVAMPGAYEIFSSELIVGRLPEKADMVIPIATVSGLHARIQNKEGGLFITDLDSTNGTFINEKRVPPGATARVPPGSLLTFGDTHLAIFRVSRLEKAQETEEPSQSEEKVESECKETTPQSETTS